MTKYARETKREEARQAEIVRERKIVRKTHVGERDTTKKNHDVCEEEGAAGSTMRKRQS